MTNQKSTIDLTRFVSIGDSITAGYADGALYYEGQLNTYPNLIAQQYSLISPISFKQALVDKHSVGVGFSGRSRLILKPDPNHPHSKLMVLGYLSETCDSNIFKNNSYISSGPFNNMAIPGAKAIHLIYPGYGNPEAGEGNYNLFFTRMASNPQQASILSDAMTMQPNFFTLFIGNNDVLAFAMSGGTLDSITPLEGPPGVGFHETLKYITDTLTQSGAKGILATIPNLISIPFFNTIPYNGLLLNQEEVNRLSVQYKGMVFHPGNNAYIVEEFINDKPVIRQLKKGELILSEILLDPLKDTYLSGSAPIPKKYTLTTQQVTFIEHTVNQYNNSIKTIAEEKQLGLVNLNRLLRNTKSDRYFDDKTRNIYYKQTGAFSLDGIHINSLGQSLLANEFIKAIQKNYGLKIPRVPIFKFRKKFEYIVDVNIYRYI
ncbi:MAG: SGNH/GDSL hydrolase family protein [Bacteroidota bacterium]